MFARNRSAWNAPFHRYLSTLGIKVSSRRGAVRRWAYERGFVEHISVTAAAVANHSNELFRIGPIRNLTAVECRFDNRIVSQWIKDPNLDQIERFWLYNVRYESSVVEERFRSKFSSRVLPANTEFGMVDGPQSETRLNREAGRQNWIQRVLNMFQT